jgi:two-component system, OmpR family, osmolarity sensor histidine kinase EnvZ
MSVLPRSLFGRLALVLLAVVAIALVATFLIFRQDRAALLVRHFGDTKVVQLQAVRTAIEASDARDHRETLLRIGREHGVRIVPEAERPMFGPGGGMGPGGGGWRGPLATEIEARLREQLGPGTEVRIQPGRQLLWVRVEAAGNGYWVGFPLPPRSQPEDEPTRAALWSVTLAAVLLFAAFLFARYLARPLRDLNAAVERVGRGETPPPLPESGPSEIANLNRGFNRMIGNLRQVEQDRALLLAGVSHDLRTPLARLRLGVEMSARNETERAEMVDDIEEMDRIIGQFLDFARGEESAAPERTPPDPLVAASVDRYTRAGNDVRFHAGDVPPVALRPTAFSRLVANLIDNALAYAAPPIEVTTTQAGGRFVLDVADRGPGIPPGEVERLKQPFTRASAARSHANGVAGAGLGLAIVDRIARMHGGAFELLPREGGGTIARVTIPLAG